MRPFPQNGGISASAPAGFDSLPFPPDQGLEKFSHNRADTPLKLIAVSQSVQVTTEAGGATRRQDVIDQSWAALLEACGCLALPVPNHPHSATRFLDEAPIDGVLLTCGNELTINGGNAPERDRTEFALVTHAVHNNLPVLGIGRGMQIIQRLFSVPLKKVDDHISPALKINVNGEDEIVNSDHRYGAVATAPGLNIWAHARDGVVKAVENKRHNLTGIMWRPDRTHPFAASDIALIRRTFDMNRRAANL